MKERIKFESKQIVSVEEDSKEIYAIARKRGIKVPSTHLGFFKTIYARIESANLNGIRLAEHAVREALPGLIGSQVNFEHYGAGFLCGTILDAWINADRDIEVVYSFYKSIYPDEYEKSIELAKEGTLSVSFELLSERESQEQVGDGTIRLHDIDFQGMGHLMDHPPAEPKAKIYEFASRCKERLSKCDNRELVCASVIEQACDEVLSHDHLLTEPMDDTMEIPARLFIVTTPDDDHFHIAELDWDGNGFTISTMGSDSMSHTHEILNWQIQKADGHTHRIMQEVVAKIKEYAGKWQTNYTNSLPNSSFAVIEPAYLNGDTGDKKARHLPYKDRDGRIDLSHYRSALDKIDQIQPITDSISTDELRKKAKAELDKHKSVLETAKTNKNESNEGRNSNVNLTEEQKQTIADLRAELGDYAKDVKDEELLDETVVAEIRKEKEAKETSEKAEDKSEEKEDEKADEAESENDSEDDKEADGEEKEDEAESEEESEDEKKDEAESEEASEEKTDLEKAQDRIAELENQVEELQSALQAKDSEIEAVRENAEKIGQMKVQLKDNEFVKDFKDEDYLDETKVNDAIQSQKNKETIATRKEELKDNEFAKDFKDEDYLDETKVENAKLKAENAKLQATKDKVTAEKDDEEAEMDTGDASDSKYGEVMASVREDIKSNQSTQKVYTRKK